MSEIYRRLMASAGEGDAFDRHLFACILAKGAGLAPIPLGAAVGLPRAQLQRLLDRFFPDCGWLLAGVPDDAGTDSIEEPDLRDLLLGNAAGPDSEVAAWLAAVVARRALAANHLWQDLGVADRAELSEMLHRHFAPLARRNTRNMKWKKFFYRELCQLEGVNLCKSPVCDVCSDFAQCFGGEEG